METVENAAVAPRTLGVTGGIGSGKTTVCRLLEGLGAEVFYADLVARRIMQEQRDAREAIRAAFGAESYSADGTLNRAWLAARVFSSASSLSRLNAIVHPRVRRAFRAMHARSDASLLVYEAALIYETGGDRHLDAVAVVDAPAGDRIARVRARDGLSEKQVAARMRHQLGRKELLQRADYVIDNSGTPQALEPQVRHLYRCVLSLD